MQRVTISGSEIAVLCGDRILIRQLPSLRGSVTMFCRHLLNHVQFSACGNRLCAVGEMGTVLVCWSMAPLKNWEYQYEPLQNMICSAFDEDKVYVGSDAGRILVLSVRTGDIILQFDYGAAVEHMALSADLFCLASKTCLSIRPRVNAVNGVNAVNAVNGDTASKFTNGGILSLVVRGREIAYIAAGCRPTTCRVTMLMGQHQVVWDMSLRLDRCQFLTDRVLVAVGYDPARAACVAFEFEAAITSTIKSSIKSCRLLGTVCFGALAVWISQCGTTLAVCGKHTVQVQPLPTSMARVAVVCLILSGGILDILHLCEPLI